MDNYTSVPRAIEIRGFASGYANLVRPASTCIYLHRHYGFYERRKRRGKAAEKRGNSISRPAGQDYTSGVSAAGRPIPPLRAEAPGSIPASRTTRVLFMRVRSYTRRSNKPVAHEVNQCTRPVGTTRRRRRQRRRRPHRFWREIKVARPGDGGTNFQSQRGRNVPVREIKTARLGHNSGGEEGTRPYEDQLISRFGE